MNGFRMWLMNFMRGRYGTDDLNRFLLIATLVLIVINMFLRWRIIELLIVALLIYVYCRMFSRNINARYMENQRFLRFTARMRSRHGQSGSGGGYGNGGSRSGSGRGRVRDKEHKVMRCPGCGEKLRVPRGAGKINITCPHCGTKFIKKV